MSHYLLDTDMLSLLQYSHPIVTQRAATHPDSDIGVGVITIQEQMRGWLARLNRLSAPDDLAAWYDRLVNRILPPWCQYGLISFTKPAIMRFEQLRLQRLNVGLMDLRIAAIALEFGLILVTQNIRDFGRIPGLIIEDWSV